ncbi:general secretion pathway protein F [Gemmobacter caeni]|jgi:general secretion pathway protein F|uniref:General secretion pathway protein F n=1 Tax=Gemmobacter caeni TaxID=589035 RepID=A0A2T6B911_9RHOB|nr:type II secretion system F family protein [Gemmobacter caeni]PTX52549.1 general secretion pathway protein F [Gemmobacter caeni]TWJ02780.1 general secretion pathway protein F [Gemmobacter caeni]
MPVFIAKVSVGGKTTQITLSASSRADAERSLKRRGRIISLKRQAFLDLQPGLSPYERYVFLVKLSTMVASKVSMGKALELMGQAFTGNIRRVSKSLSDRVNAGVNFITAIEEERKSFPASLTALIRAGFAAGNASNALREAAEFEQMMQNIRKGSMKEVWTGFGYFAASAALTVATVEYFGPMVTGNAMFQTPGVNTAWIESFGRVFMWVNIVLLAIMSFMAFMGTIGRRASPALIDRVIARIPFYSDLILAKSNYITFYKLSLLIKSGVRIEETLEITASDMGPGSLKSDIIRALDMVRKGRPWASGMETLDPTDRASLLASSDRDDVARTFRLLADQFRDLYIARMQTLGPALNILAALFMSIASAILFGLTILPMLQLAASI